MFKAYGIFDSFLTEKYFFFKTMLVVLILLSQNSDFRFSFLELADQRKSSTEKESRELVFLKLFSETQPNLEPKFTKNIAKNQSHGDKYYFSFISIAKYLKLSMDFKYVPNGFHRKSSMNFDISDLVCIKYLTLHVKSKSGVQKFKCDFIWTFIGHPFTYNNFLM